MSTDTRELADRLERVVALGNHAVEFTAEEARAILAALAHSAPEERGEGEVIWDRIVPEAIDPLAEAAYSGAPPKKWIRERTLYAQGFNDCRKKVLAVLRASPPAPVEGEPREVGIVREVGMAWECTRCGALLGAGLDVCEAAYDEDVGYTPHPPVYRPDGVAAPVEGGKRYNLSAPNGGNHQLSAPVEGEREASKLPALADAAWRVAKYHTDGAYESYHPEAYHALVDLDAALASHPVQGAEGGMSFGAAIREARVAAGLSLRDAAALLGVTVEYLGAVERGLPAPSHTDLMISPEAIDEALADTRRAIEQQGAGGGEREEPVWPRGYTVRIAVEALEGVSVCASLSEQDPDGAWVVMREVTECSTVDAALRALASWEPAPLPQRMECPYCLAVWRPHSVADAECCPSCLRDLPPLASPAPSAPEEEP